MPELTTSTFLYFNDRALSLQEICGQMLLFGKLQPFLRELASQQVILQEINRRDDLEVDSTDLMQAIMDFRLQSQLTDQAQFAAWLASEHQDNAIFQQWVLLELKLKKLKALIAAPDLPAYFEQHQVALAELQLTSVVLSDEAAAHALKTQIANSEDWQQLVTTYAASHEQLQVQTGTQRVQRRALPVELQAPFTSVTPGDVVGPINLQGAWCLFRVDEITPAELDAPTQQQLEDQLFSQWLVQQLSTVQISLDAPLKAESQ